MKCPHNPEITCAYLEQYDPVVYSCGECTHYKATIADNDPIGGGSLIGCLLIGITLAIGFLVLAGHIIHQLRLRP